MTKLQYQRNSYADPKWAFLLGLIAIAAAIGLGMRALDTGSWQQYGLTFVCTIYGLNRLVHAVVYLAKGKAVHS